MAKPAAKHGPPTAEIFRLVTPFDVNSLFTLKIKSLTDSESSELLDFLCEHIKQEKYQCRFSWEINSIAFWDNRSVIHKPDNDYWPQLRRMERITIDNTTPPS